MVALQCACCVLHAKTLVRFAAFPRSCPEKVRHSEEPPENRKISFREKEHLFLPGGSERVLRTAPPAQRRLLQATLEVDGRGRQSTNFNA
eukprot:746452-Prymnesium_polylepis.1